MKKSIVSLILVLAFIVAGVAVAEAPAAQQTFTAEQQAFDAYLDIAFVYDGGVKYLEELGDLWERTNKAGSVSDLHDGWFRQFLIGNASTGFARFSSLNNLATGKYGYKSAEGLYADFSAAMKGRSNKTDAVWVCLSLLEEAGYIKSPASLGSSLDQAMEGIRAVMALDREYPFLKDLQNYYKDAKYLYEYIADFNDNYASFSGKLDEFQKARSSWATDFEFIYDKTADVFDAVYEARRSETR